PELQSQRCKRRMLLPGQNRPDFICNREVHDHDGAAKYQMKMSRHPRGIVHHGVHAVAVINDPAEPAETEHGGRRPRAKHYGAFTWQGNDPAEPTSSTAKPTLRKKR